LLLRDVEPAQVGQLSDDQLRELLANAVHVTSEDRKQNQILFYKPVSSKSQEFHDSKAKIVAAGGGNGSSKTETMLVEMVMCMTGVFPYSQRHLIDQKWRGPIQTRLTVESLTTTLETIIIPKLQWWKWTGVDQQGGARGHWGWIPKDCLIDGEWDRSWSAKLRVLRVLCRDPLNHDRVLGESTMQFMSTDQDPADFASGDFHICGHDEPPTLAIWRENEARKMRVGGRLLLAMTWPDDPAIQVDWLYDEVYEPARSGSDPEIKWLELWSTENPHLKQDEIAYQADKWSTEIANVRIYGRPIRFSNRVHPEFTDNTKTWCFRCGKSTVKVVTEAGRDSCGTCGADQVVDYNHVTEFDASHNWPTVFLLDPHPRKPHMWLWVQIDASDDWWVVNEDKLEGDCVEVFARVQMVEREMGLYVAQRLMDPNMGASPSGQKRDVTWQDEFSSAGLHCDLASDVDVGRARFNTMLKPDDRTLRPRAHVHARCKNAIYQLNRYSWANYNKNLDRDLKQTPKDRHDDYPTLIKYLANSAPVFRFLKGGAPVLGSGKRRRAAYS
jgi:hypothetical protein